MTIEIRIQTVHKVEIGHILICNVCSKRYLVVLDLEIGEYISDTGSRESARYKCPHCYSFRYMSKDSVQLYFKSLPVSKAILTIT